MVWEPTTDQILNLDGVRRRADSFRFELCDRDLRPIGQLHPDRTGSAISIQNDVSNNTSRRLTNFKLLPDEASEVDTVGDRLRVYMVLQNGVEFRLGTFIWAAENEPRRSWGDELHAELVDFNYILDKKTTQAFGWGRGATIVLIMIFLLNRAGFQLSQVYPIGPEATRGLADPLSWQPGTTWLQMLTDLGNLVGFASPWWDRDCLLHLDQPPEPSFASPSVPAYGLDTRVISDSIIFSKGLLNAANDFGVFDSGTSQLRVGRYQLPSSAPHSFANRGYRIGETKSVQGTSSQDIVNKSARTLAQTSDVFEYVTFSSTLDPRHDTYEIVSAFEGPNWLETGWNMELLSGGSMQHTMRRIFYDVV